MTKGRRLRNISTNLIFLFSNLCHCWVYSCTRKLLLIIDNKKTFQLPPSAGFILVLFHFPLNPAHLRRCFAFIQSLRQSLLEHNVEWNFLHYFMPFCQDSYRVVLAARSQPQLSDSSGMAKSEKISTKEWIVGWAEHSEQTLNSLAFSHKVPKFNVTRGRAQAWQRVSEWMENIYFEMRDNDDINYTVQVYKSVGQSSIILGELSLSWACEEEKPFLKRHQIDLLYILSQDDNAAHTFRRTYKNMFCHCTTMERNEELNIFHIHGEMRTLLTFTILTRMWISEQGG